MARRDGATACLEAVALAGKNARGYLDFFSAFKGFAKSAAESSYYNPKKLRTIGKYIICIAVGLAASFVSAFIAVGFSWKGSKYRAATEFMRGLSYVFVYIAIFYAVLLAFNLLTTAKFQFDQYKMARE